MNLRLLEVKTSQQKHNKIKIIITVDDNNTMLGINRNAITIKNQLELYLNRYFNTNKTFFYPNITTHIRDKIFNTRTDIHFRTMKVYNHVLYVKWKFDGSDNLYCITSNFKDVKNES